MDTPTASDLRLWAPPKFDWAAYGLAEAQDDPLGARLSLLLGEFTATTGRELSSITVLEEPTARQALGLLVMEWAARGSQAALDALEDPGLRSEQAGSWSMSRFSPADLAAGGPAGQQRAPYGRVLWGLLWMLMTDAKRAEWRSLLSGEAAPAVGWVSLGCDEVPEL